MKIVKIVFFCESKEESVFDRKYPVIKIRAKMPDKTNLTDEIVLQIAKAFVPEGLAINNIETEIARPQIAKMERWNLAPIYTVK